MQSNLQHVADQIVETAQTQIASQVRDDLDEKIPENVVATIIPPERSQDIDEFLQGLPNIPEKRTRAAIISVGGRLAAILLDPPVTKGMSQGSVSEIPLIRLMPGHSVEDQLALLAGQDTDSETSSVFYVPGTSQQAIEAGETEAQRLLQSEREIDAIRNTMWTMYKLMKSFPEGDPRIADVQQQIDDLEQQHIAKSPEGEGYLDTVQQAWEMDNPE
jgi:acyl carrier protein phosphodiesterase